MYTKKNQVTRGIFHGIPFRKHCIACIYTSNPSFHRNRHRYSRESRSRTVKSNLPSKSINIQYNINAGTNIWLRIADLREKYVISPLVLFDANNKN